MADTEKPGWLAPILWGVIGLVGTVILAAIVGVAAYDSESAGMTATYVVSFPAGFLWAGFWGALLFHFVTPNKRGVRVAAPFGCAFVGGVALLALIFLFFAAIFPSL